MYSVNIEADSIAEGGRLTTMTVTFPRLILPEMTRHRVFSWSVESNRAMPLLKVVEQVRENPFIPLHFGSEMRGMVQGGDEIDQEWATSLWLRARDRAVDSALALSHIGTHHSVCNDILSPYQWTTAVVTGTEWDNFFNLRCKSDAKDEMYHIAQMMWQAMVDSQPEQCYSGNWHLPFITPEERSEILHRDVLAKLSAARCARMSYGGVVKRDVKKDLALAERLLNDQHWSPFEHQAALQQNMYLRSNLVKPWMQYRKMIGG